MIQLSLHSAVKVKCDEAIIITGAARSGTTIMAKLIHSMEGVECAHEPAMLYSLASLIDQLDHREWEVLYETYLYQELLFGMMAGRALNCNVEDDSSIFKVKDRSWVEERLSRSIRQREIEAGLESSTIAYKAVCFAQYIGSIQESYPRTRVVMMLRSANDVLNSSFERRWFSDEMLRTQNLLGPGYFVDGMKVPFWVCSSDVDLWMQWDELHRSAYYYVQAHRGMESIKHLHTVKYDELVLRPEQVILNLAENLGLKFGPKTRDILTQVSRTEKDRDETLVNRLGGEMLERVMYYSRLSKVQ